MFTCGTIERIKWYKEELLKHVTYHKGTIHSVIYHVKDREWNYYICEDNKKVSKRYSSADLKSAISQQVEPIKNPFHTSVDLVIG